MRYARFVSFAFLAAMAFAAPPLRGQEPPARTREARGWLGFSYGADGTRIVVWTPGPRATPPAEQVVIGEVLKGSPADRAGMEPGDTLVRINGEPATLGRMSDAARRLHPGDTIRLQVRRAGKDQTLTLVAGRRPSYLSADLPWADQMRISINGDSIRRVMHIYMDSARMKIDSMPFPHTVVHNDSIIIMQYGRGGRADTLRIPSMDSMRAFYMPRVRVLRDSVLSAMPRVHVFGSDEFPGTSGFEVELIGRRAVAGAGLQELTPQLAEYFGVHAGVLVETVTRGTPAARAGLQAGDVVTAAGGHAVNRLTDFRSALRGRQGDVKLDIVRKGKKQQVTIKWP
jgi:membrane-associated protease RseP (regulator of RpoE activity)